MSVSRLRNGWTWFGIGVIAVSAAVMSFSALWRLAERANVAVSLAWLLPVAVDATIVVATRVWLIGDAGTRVTRYARRLAITALLLSVAGNAAEHGMAAYGVAAPWWVLVAVSAVPPAALGATVHLAALLSSAPQPAASRPAATNGVRRSARPKQVATATPEARSAKPTTPIAASSKPGNGKRDGDKAALMRATFDRYVAEGRLDELTGAVLARSAGASPSLGRRYLGQWRAELTETEEPAA